MEAEISEAMADAAKSENALKVGYRTSLACYLTSRLRLLFSILRLYSLLWIRSQLTKINADPCGFGSTTLLKTYYVGTRYRSVLRIRIKMMPICNTDRYRILLFTLMRIRLFTLMRIWIRLLTLLSGYNFSLLCLTFHFDADLAHILHIEAPRPIACKQCSNRVIISTFRLVTCKQ